MQNLVEKYKIDEKFYHKYFEYNSQMIYAIKGIDFMLFQRGCFPNPKYKKEEIDKILKELINSFYENNEIILPKLDFIITTICTLKCKDCSSMIPYYKNHTVLSFDEFKRNLDKILETVSRMYMLNISGGEPLTNKDLAKMIDYAASNDKIDMVKIITNGTIIPNDSILDVIKKYNKKVYFFISNYSINPKLKGRLKVEELIFLLKQNNIKHQKIKDFVWLEEEPMQYRGHCDKYLKEMFSECMLASCLGVFRGKIHTCPKSSLGEGLGIFQASDAIDLSEGNIKEKLIDFYKKEYFNACKYCIRTSKEVVPALQIGE